MDFTGIIAEYDPFHNGHARPSWLPCAPQGHSVLPSA